MRKVSWHIRAEPLPPKIMYTQILPHVLSMERTLLAVKTGDRALLLWNLLDNHATQSYRQAEDVLEAVLNLDFNQEMNEYFR